MDRLLFGDNQFFGVNHMSEEKARAQSMRGTMDLGDQRGTISGRFAPSPSATALTCAKYAISPGPPT